MNLNHVFITTCLRSLYGNVWINLYLEYSDATLLVANTRVAYQDNI